MALIPHQASATRAWSSGVELQSQASAVEFDVTSGTAVISTSIKRSGAASLRVNPSASTIRKGQEFTGSTERKVYIRTYVYVASYPGALEGIFSCNETVQGGGSEIQMNTDGTLELWDLGNSVQIGSDSSALSLNRWYRLEMYCDASDTTWEATALIDGTSFASATNIAAPGAGGTWQLVVGSLGFTGTGTYDMYFDDMAANITSGTAQTSYPGEGSIVHMQPDSAGDTNGCSAGDYTSIDEITPDNATTICVLDADTGGDVIEVNTESAKNAGIDYFDTVTLVMVGVREAQASAASATFAPVIRSASGGTRLSGTSISHNDTTYRTNGDTAPRIYGISTTTDPTTGAAWTPTGTNSLDNMQIGINCTDCNPDTNISTVWALVEYVNVDSPTNVSSTTVTTFSSSVTAMPVDMPESVDSGDLLISLVEVRNSGTWTVPPGWTEFAAQTGGGGGVGELTAFYKIADGTEDSAQVSWTASAGTTAIWHTRLITAWDGSTAPEAATTSGDSSAADPPSLSPSWGSANTLWIAVAGHAAASASAWSAGPSGYSDFLNSGASSGGSAVSIAAPYLYNTASSEDPGAFTVSGSNRFWATMTIGVKPTGGAPPAVSVDGTVIWFYDDSF